jgi:hypothetical protein
MNGYEIVGIGIIVIQWWLIVSLLNRVLKQAGQKPISPLSDISESIRAKPAPMKIEHERPAASGTRKVLL